MLIRHAVKIVIFSPVIAPHAAALQRRRYIRSPRSDVGCVIRSGVQARLVSSGGEEGKGRGKRGEEYSNAALLYGNNARCKDDGKIRGVSRRGDITSC